MMNAELLRELIEYRTSKQKSVMMASRSILQLYRIINPEMLPRKERVFINYFRPESSYFGGFFGDLLILFFSRAGLQKL